MSEQTRTQYRGNGQASPEELEQEMAATRAEMNETLSALGQRLSPEALLHQAMEQFGGTGEFARNFSEALKRNPVPAALTGIGMGGMMLAHRQGWSTQPVSSGGPGATEKMKRRAAGSFGKGQETMGRTTEGASETAHELRDRAEEYSARTRARISKATESARGWSSGAQARGADAGARAGEFFREQPLVVGALAVGIGALVGAAIQKRSEPQELTQTREQLGRSAREAASQAMEQGGEVARAAEQAGAEKAREVTSGEGHSHYGSHGGGHRPGAGEH